MALADLFRKKQPEKKIHVIRVAKAAPADASSTQIDDAQYLTDLYNEGKAIRPPYDLRRLLNLTETNEIHSACIGAKSTDSVGRGFKIKAKDRAVDPMPQEEIENELDEICDEMSFQEMLVQVSIDRYATGWAAWEVSRDDDGNINGLFQMPPQTMRATKDPKVYLQAVANKVVYFKSFGADGFLDRTNGNFTDTHNGALEASEVIVFKRYSSINKHYGIPDFVSAVPSMAEYAAIRDFNVSFFETSGVMSKMFFIKSDMDVEEVVDEVETTLKDAQGRAHSVLVSSLPADAEIQEVQVGAAIKEGSFRERREDLVKSILIAHGVPPYRIGWAQVGSLGGSTASEMMDAYKFGVVKPDQALIKRRLIKTLFGPKGLNLVDYDFDFVDFDWEETKLKLSVSVQGVRYGILSPNQARAEIGKEKSDDPAMDKFYFNGKPIDVQAAEQATTQQNNPNNPPEPLGPGDQRGQQGGVTNA